MTDIIKSSICEIERTRNETNIDEVSINSQDSQEEHICLSTQYYRRNKTERIKIHKCPHCSYETTGAKHTLTAHINAKHTDEKDKPHYCCICEKGFAQAANYEKHMLRVHDKVVKVTKTREERRPFVYVVTMGECEPVSKSTKARAEYYRGHKHIKAELLGQIIYGEKKKLTQKDLHYDKKNGYISFTVYTKEEFAGYIKVRNKIRQQRERQRK